VKRNIRTAIIAIVAIIVAAVAFATGLLDWKKVQWRAERAVNAVQSEFDRAGSKPVRPAHNRAAAQKCRENLALIEGAKRRVADEKRIPGGGGVSWEEIGAELKKRGIKSIPRCPSGGTYTLMPTGMNVKCSVGANNTPSREDDHIYLD